MINKIAGNRLATEHRQLRADFPCIINRETAEVAMEEWKEIKGYEDLYAVSNKGRVKRLARTDCRGHKLTEFVLKPFRNNGTNKRYDLRIGLRKDIGHKNLLVSRLVATVFVDNPDNKPEVNHIDENILNNTSENLEWVTTLENVRHGTGIARRTETLKYVSTCNKPVKQFSLAGVFIRVWRSCHDAGRKLGISFKGISGCAIGTQKTTGGYRWVYLNNFAIENGSK